MDAQDYLWAVSMEQEAAIQEVMLWTKADYTTAKKVMATLALHRLVSFQESRETAIRILLEVPNSKLEFTLNLIKRGIDWRTVLE